MKKRDLTLPGLGDQKAPREAAREAEVAQPTARPNDAPKTTTPAPAAQAGNTRPPLVLSFNTLPPTRTMQAGRGVRLVGGKPHFFTRDPQREEAASLVAAVSSALPAGWRPFEGPVSLRIRLCYPYRASERRSVVNAGLEVPKATRPDLDNICKALLDALTRAQAWRDDGQVAVLRVSKVFGPRAYWRLRVAPLAADGIAEGGAE